MANPIPKHSFMRGKNQNNLSGVNLNMKHDEASSLKSHNGNSVGKKKFKETCFVCKKQRHIYKDCCHCKGKNAQNKIIENVDEKAAKLVVVMLEVNLVDNPKKWWIDIGATCHVCFGIIFFLSMQQPLMENNYSWITF
jgi:hypothetical protein